MSIRSLQLLGTPRLESDGAAINPGRRKALALLAYLAVTREMHTREALSALLLPDHDRARAYAYLRNMLWAINTALGADWAVVEADAVGFNPDSGITIDTIHFDERIAGWLPAGEIDPASRPDRIAALMAAASLYRGDFMAGFSLPDAPDYSDWQFFQMESWKRKYAALLDVLSLDQAETGDTKAAIASARQWVALDALHEPAHRRLIELYAQAGEAAAGLRHYQALVATLERELGVAPEPETTALVEMLQHNRSAPAPRRSAPTPQITVAAQPAPVSNLPAQTTPFIGRTQELTEIAGLLQDPACRLLTIVGPGGMGKTRLAIQAGAESAFTDGTWFISLAPVLSVDYMASSVLAALPFAQTGIKKAEEDLLDALRSKSLLLILDNFEHLLDGAEVISRILAHAPGVKVLVTSRERLNLHEEWLYEIQGLAFPELDQRTFENGGSEAYGALALFVNSARRIRPDFTLTAEDSPHVVDICHMVEGMPLGIELAASWVQVLSCGDIAREIRKSLDFLTTSMRNLPARHRSLRAVFESSWQQLAPHEQTSLAQLSVFRGGFTLEAAAAVAGASLHLLLALVEKSLLRRERSGRFEMHEMLRQYAGQKLDEASEAATHERHCAYYTRFLEEQFQLHKGPQQPAALHAIGLEIDNIRSAGLNALNRRDSAALRIMIEPLFHFFHAHNRHQQQQELLARAVEIFDPPQTADERLLLGFLLGYYALTIQPSQHFDTVLALIDRGLELLQEFEGHPATALPLMLMGRLKARPGRTTDECERLIRQGIAVAKAHRDTWGVAFGLNWLGQAQHMQIRYAEARQALHQSLEIFREKGSPYEQALVLEMLAESMHTLGHVEQTRTYVLQAVKLMEQAGLQQQVHHLYQILDWYNNSAQQNNAHDTLIATLNDFLTAGDRRGAAWARYHMAWVDHFHGRNDLALSRYQESLHDFVSLGDEEGLAWCHIFMASVYVALGQLDTARQHIESSRAVMAGMQFPWGECGALYILGNAALAEHDYYEAHRLYVEAVRIAYAVHSILQTLRHLAGIADVLLHLKEVERAYALAYFIHQHPTSWEDTVKRTGILLEQARQILPESTIMEVEAQSKLATLESVVEQVLAENVSR